MILPNQQMVAMNPKQTFMDKIKKGNTSLFVNPNIPVKKFAPSDDEVNRFVEGIRKTETGYLNPKEMAQAGNNPYQFHRWAGLDKAGNDMGRARGSYQITDQALKTDVNRGIITPETAREISNNDKSKNNSIHTKIAQDMYIKNLYKTYTKEGYTPQMIADAHNGGFTKYLDKTKRLAPGQYQSPDYMTKFNKNYQPQPPAVAQIPR